MRSALLSRSAPLRRSAAAVRPRAPRTLRALRRELAALRTANAAATARATEHRHLRAFTEHHRWKQQQQQTGREDGATAAQVEAAEKKLQQGTTRLLPTNPELEAAVAFTIRDNRDARTELELTRQLLGSTLLSLASPVGPWDPYDVKPQVFALDNFLVLPVFTSLAYLELFCRRFGYTVRDPSGVRWVRGDDAATRTATSTARQLTAPPSVVTESAWWARETKRQQQQRQHEERPGQSEPVSSSDAPEEDTAREPQVVAPVPSVGADTLFDLMEDALPLGPVDATRRGAEKRRRKGRKRRRDHARASARGGGNGSRERRRRRRGWKRHRPSSGGAKAGSAPPHMAAEDSAASSERSKAKEAFWRTVADVAPFRLTQATPLPAFGPFVYPFFFGYFADVNTLLHNASIVPEKVDILLNPLSPIEFVLAREATDRILHRDQLLLLAYQRVEKELQREFGSFFAAHCPEVRSASSACVPRPLDYTAAASARAASRGFSNADNPLQEQRAKTRVLRESEYAGDATYEIVVLLCSDDLAATYRCLQWGKSECVLMGHADLDVLPMNAAAPHVAEAAQMFYSAADASINKQGAQPLDADTQQRTRASLGAFQKLGGVQTVSVTQPAESFYHDPTNAYTEAHSVFTEELKVKRGQ